MKSLLALILSVSLVALASPVIAGDRGYFATDNEPIYGTWVNMDYTMAPAKRLVIKPDGTIGVFYNLDSKTPDWRARYLISGKWTDAAGNIMYKTHFVGNWGGEGYGLHKISNSGKTREAVMNPTEHPKEIDPKSGSYTIYYRK
jgi:hypothetical protein